VFIACWSYFLTTTAGPFEMCWKLCACNLPEILIDWSTVQLDESSKQRHWFSTWCSRHYAGLLCQKQPIPPPGWDWHIAISNHVGWTVGWKKRIHRACGNGGQHVVFSPLLFSKESCPWIVYMNACVHGFRWVLLRISTIGLEYHNCICSMDCSLCHCQTLYSDLGKLCTIFLSLLPLCSYMPQVTPCFQDFRAEAFAARGQWISEINFSESLPPNYLELINHLKIAQSAVKIPVFILRSVSRKILKTWH